MAGVTQPPGSDPAPAIPGSLWLTPSVLPITWDLGKRPSCLCRQELSLIPAAQARLHVKHLQAQSLGSAITGRDFSSCRQQPCEALQSRSNLRSSSH